MYKKFIIIFFSFLFFSMAGAEDIFLSLISPEYENPPIKLASTNNLNKS